MSRKNTPPKRWIECVTHQPHAATHKKWKNDVKTSQYTVLNFIPKNLFEQSHSFINIFFYFSVLLQFFDDVSDSFGNPTLLLPLAFVILVTMVRDSVDDIKRHIQDREENDSNVHCFVEGRLRVCEWRDLKCGDIVKLRCNERVPCDLVLLSTSSSTCQIYVETKNLDGESNLKIKSAIPALREFLLDDAGVAKFRAVIRYEPPNAVLDSFNGNLLHEDGYYTLTEQQLLLRGSHLACSNWIYGCVVYVGHQTRIYQNALALGQRRRKQSRLSKSVQRHVGCLILFMCSLCFGMALLTKPLGSILHFQDENIETMSFSDLVVYRIKTFFTFFLLFNYYVPISLVISLDIVRMFQATYTIQYDSKIASPETRAISQNAGIIEDLGEITHVFCDKTGTLTRNRMVFSSLASSHSCGYSAMENPSNERSDGSLVHRNFQKENFWANVRDGERSHVLKLCLVISLCHSVVLSKEKEVEKESCRKPRFRRAAHLLLCATKKKRIMETFSETEGEDFEGFENVSIEEFELGADPVYSATSPDELALVYGAKELGFYLLSRPNRDYIDLLLSSPEARDLFLTSDLSDGTWSESDTRVRFRLLDVLEFDNERKAMTCIVRCPSGKILALTKGADSHMLPRASSRQDEITGILKRYSSSGLRTLVCGTRQISEEDYKTWKVEYDIARENSESRLKSIFDLEKNMELCGVTGVEDELQDEVPEVLRDLKAAGCGILILTGDKMETATNIAQVCGLLSDDIVHLSSSDEEVLREQLNGIRQDLHLKLLEKKPTRGAKLRKLKELDSQKIWDAVVRGLKKKIRGTKKKQQKKPTTTMMCSGDSLYTIFANEDLRQIFISLALICHSVIAYRMAPKQKAECVKYAKDYSQENGLLAIGDGANDVGMIVEAQVGVAIVGREGRSAVGVSDFAIAEFRFLRRLMFVHGREAVRRNSFLVYFTIYKNAYLATIASVYGIFSYFSGSDIFNIWQKQIFNLVYASVPILIYAVVDRQLDHDILEKAVTLYRNAGERQPVHSFKNFLYWYLQGIYASIVTTLLALFHFGPSFSNSSGLSASHSHSLIGLVVYLIVLLVVTLVVIMETTVLHVCFLIGCGLCVVSWFALVEFQSSLDSVFGELGISKHALQFMFVECPTSWFLIPLTIFFCLAPIIILTTDRWLTNPSKATVIRERLKEGVHDVLVEPRDANAELKVVSVVRIQKQTPRLGYAFSEENKFRHWHEDRNNII